jgi:hypothetical protein
MSSNMVVLSNRITGGVYQCPAPFKVWVDNEEQRAQMDSRLPW